MNRHITFEFAISNVLHIIWEHFKRDVAMLLLCDCGLTLIMMSIFTILFFTARINNLWLSPSSWWLYYKLDYHFALILELPMRNLTFITAVILIIWLLVQNSLLVHHVTCELVEIDITVLVLNNKIRWSHQVNVPYPFPSWCHRVCSS